MFFEQTKLLFDIKEAALSNTPPAFIPILQNILHQTVHRMELTVHDADITMTVDDLPQSHAAFTLAQAAQGYISLVSNSHRNSGGAFVQLTILEQDNVVFDLDFRQLKDLSDLEQWFDCYYFRDLNGKKAVKVPIADFWALTERHTLKCIKPLGVLDDITDFCMLTLSLRQFQNFKAILTFEQCGYRYGLSFGCKLAQFPYYRNSTTMGYKATSGGFAYVQQEGYRTVRGNLDQSLCSTPDRLLNSYDTKLPTFYSADARTCVSPPFHTIRFHISSDAIYHIKDKMIYARTGNITYLPPNTVYKSIFTVDNSIVISFDLLSGGDFEAESCEFKSPNDLKYLFERLMALYSSESTQNFFHGMYLLNKIFFLIQKEKIGNIANETANYPPNLKPAFLYLNKNFTNPDLRIPDLAKMCHMSETRFRLSFHQYTKMSPQQYIQKKRIDYAIFLLDSDFYKIYEVSEKSGFTNTKYFSTVFKSLTGMSPTEWLKKR